MSDGSDASLDPLQPLEHARASRAPRGRPAGRQGTSRVGADDHRRVEPAAHQDRARHVPRPVRHRRVRPLRGAVRARPSSWGRPSRCRRPRYWLGTDFLGRDVLTRVLYGGLSVFVLGIAATVIGIVLGRQPGPHLGLRATLGGREHHAHARRGARLPVHRAGDAVRVDPRAAALADRAHGRHLAHAPHRPRHARRDRGAGGARLRQGGRGRRRAAAQDPPLRGAAQHQQPAARGVRPAPHLLDHHDRGALVHRLRHAAARPPTGA